MECLSAKETQCTKCIHKGVCKIKDDFQYSLFLIENQKLIGKDGVSYFEGERIVDIPYIIVDVNCKNFLFEEHITFPRVPSDFGRQIYPKTEITCSEL